MGPGCGEWLTGDIAHKGLDSLSPSASAFRPPQSEQPFLDITFCSDILPHQRPGELSNHGLKT